MKTMKIKKRASTSMSLHRRRSSSTYRGAAFITLLATGSLTYVESVKAETAHGTAGETASMTEARQVKTSMVILEQPYLSLEQYAGIASDVLHVVVTGIEQRGGEHEIPQRRAHLGVMSSFYGETGNGAMVTFAGGSYPGGELIVQNAPELVPGNEYVLFVAEVPGFDGYALLGLGDGTYSLEHNAGSESMVRGLHARKGVELSDFQARVIEARETFLTRQEVR
jgi:hypothetical protein